MTKETRRRIDAGLKAKIALEALREQATGRGPCAALRGPPHQINAGKKKLQDQAARAFDHQPVRGDGRIHLLLRGLSAHCWRELNND
jgi:hypothetical protein